MAGDLRHVLAASGVGAELLASALPVSKAARLAAKQGGGKPSVAAALTDGEDFELLFTVASARAVQLLDAWKSRFPDLRLTCVGKITATRGLILRYPDRAREITEHGYEHFA